MGKPETLERRYLGKITKKALSFMKALLKLDPEERLNSKEALNHRLIYRQQRLIFNLIII